jgi:protein phosphatase
MGGVRGGQQASTLAVAAIKSFVEKKKIPDNIKKFFDHIVAESNKAVYEQAIQNDELRGMGTTLVIALIKGNVAHFANVGDSRAYHITNGSITQVTKDHSAVQELIDRGYLSEKLAKTHPNKNVITRAIGIEENVEYDYFKLPVEKGDTILLCTDGMSNNIDENEIQFETVGGDFEEIPKRLIDLANTRGGSDNITVAAIQI